MFRLTTPRQAIGEIFRSAQAPRNAKQFRRHLEDALEKRGLLDMYMASTAIDALMREEGEAFFGPRRPYREGAH